MSRLIIVAGASGAGKSFLLQNIVRLYPSIQLVRKLTTRSARPYESSDIREKLDLELERSLDEVEACEFRYRYGNEWYGVRKQDIDRIILQRRHPIVIVRNCHTIERLESTYADTLILYLQSGLSGADLKQKLAAQGRQDIHIEERMQRLQTDFRDYCRHMQLFHHVLINYYEADSLLDQMESVLKFELPSEETLTPRVFVLMSFNRSLNRVYHAMKTAGRLAGIKDLRVERIDAKRGDYKITSEILRSIRAASLLVCDLTEERPNVYYELGYSRGIKKKVIHCAQKGTELHFDVKDFKTIFYEDPLDLQEQLEAEFRIHFGSSA